MSMATAFDKLFDVFINWQTLIFCLGLYLLTFVSRTVTEFAWKGAKVAPVYNELILPIAPILLGSVVALLARNYPWPIAIASTVAGKVMYGGLCGFVSAKVYARFMVILHASAENGNKLAQKLLKVEDKPSEGVAPKEEPEAAQDTPVAGQ